MKTSKILLATTMALTMNAKAQIDTVNVLPPSNVTKAITELAENPYFKHAQVAILAVDTKTGQIIGQLNPDMSLKPASNMKLFSTAAALELYGPNHTYQTKLVYSGKIDQNGLLKGDIIIIGGGDPTLGSRFFFDKSCSSYISNMVKAISDAGITNIQGNIIADATCYGDEVLPTTWSWEDIGNYYGAVPSGLTNHDNMTTLHFKTGEKESIAQYTGCTPEVKGITIEVLAKAADIKSENTNTFGLPYQFHKTISGPMPANRGEVNVKTIIPDPALYMAQELYDSLASAGITTLGKPFNARNQKRYLTTKESLSTTELLTITSPTLARIIEQTNLWSVNLFAEHCLSLIGLKQVKTTEVNAASAALMVFWKKKGMDIEGLSINDGCGLSHYNIITPRQMCFLLTYMKTKSQYYKEFDQSLTKCGEKGTMSSMCKNTRAWKNARGKSGSIRRVKAYSGYVKSRSGRDIAFSILINNFSCKSAESRDEMAKIIAALADYNE